MPSSPPEPAAGAAGGGVAPAHLPFRCALAPLTVTMLLFVAPVTVWDLAAPASGAS